MNWQIESELKSGRMEEGAGRVGDFRVGWWTEEYVYSMFIEVEAGPHRRRASPVHWASAGHGRQSWGRS